MIIRRSLLRQGRNFIHHRSLANSRLWSSTPIWLEASLEPTGPESSEVPSENQAIDSNEYVTFNDEVNAGRLSQKVAKHLAHRQRVKAIGNLGAKVNQSYQPYTLTRNPPSISEVTLELLLASQAHLGHATSLWNPANARYIFGIRDGIHIISLEQTAAHLRRAAKVVQAVSERGGIILFAGTRKKQAPYVVKAATLAGGYHLYEKWIPGTLTNAFVILGKATLKVVDQLDRPLDGFEEQLFDRAPFKPDLVVCLNPRENYTMLHECATNNIPTIGVIDTNSNPTWVTYPIPANDDSHRCMAIIAGVLGRAGEEGRNRRLEAASAGEVPFHVQHHLVLPKDVETGVDSDDRVLNLAMNGRAQGEIRFAPVKPS